MSSFLRFKSLLRKQSTVRSAAGTGLKKNLWVDTPDFQGLSCQGGNLTPRFDLFKDSWGGNKRGSFRTQRCWASRSLPDVEVPQKPPLTSHLIQQVPGLRNVSQGFEDLVWCWNLGCSGLIESWMQQFFLPTDFWYTSGSTRGIFLLLKMGEFFQPIAICEFLRGYCNVTFWIPPSYEASSR